ncbi:MAG: hypothetical protein R2729_24855 [Bryobacteraceae bacterium]
MLLLTVTGMASAQSGALAGSGYRIPTPRVVAAPGQLLMFSVTGIPVRLAGPARAAPGPDGYPARLEGFEIRLAAGEQSLAAPFVAVQQTGCAAPCSPVTSFTILVPRDIVPQRWFDSRYELEVFDNAALAVRVPLRPVADNVHLLNSCDQALIHMSIFDGVGNAADCLPALLQDNRLVNTENPVRPGSALGAYLFGLGDMRMAEGANYEATVQEFTVHFDYRPNAPASRPTPGYSLTTKPFFSAGYPGGLYQMNFFVPPVPDDARTPACDGVAIRSNLTITIAGPSSMDSAAFCINVSRPQANAGAPLPGSSTVGRPLQ